MMGAKEAQRRECLLAVLSHAVPRCQRNRRDNVGVGPRGEGKFQFAVPGLPAQMLCNAAALNCRIPGRATPHSPALPILHDVTFRPSSSKHRIALQSNTTYYPTDESSRKIPARMATMTEDMSPVVKRQ